MHSAFDTQGIPRADDNAIRRIVGLPLDEAIQRLAPQVTAEYVDALRGLYSQAWQVMRAEGVLNEPLYPGTIDVLRHLEETGWVLGVATGKSYRGLIGTLEKHSVLDRFVTLQTADKASGKPHPEMLHNAMSEAGAQVETTVMIGDTTFDIEMAGNAGVTAIGVAWGYHGTLELERAGAHQVINDFHELPIILEELIRH